ncbi:probable WRKY transcription factor protein 1 [Drosophila madeirensis]|uniref:Probable WRKY transcription factor protein 1 n=1 Tax=Drosophila madeirensis TaxID=30013 RepID=A0AAU9FV95_DROMD
MEAAANKSPKHKGGNGQGQWRLFSRSSSSHISTYLGLLMIVFGALSMLLAGNCVNGQIDGYIAGEDYPAYDAVPKGLAFNCQGRQPGYYADTETRCQVWHWCLHSGHQYSFLCPNGTVFNQAVRVCDWWSNVNCASSEQLYQNNDELYRIPERNQQQQQQQNDV